MLLSVYEYVYYAFLHPMWKWMLRRLTGKCELLRITLSVPRGAQRTCNIESSLKHSKIHTLKGLLAEDNVNIDDAVANIMRIKSVSPEIHPQFGPTLRMCLCQICGYRQLISEVESTRRIQYCSENSEHEALLSQLWSKLKPDTQLTARISKQWTEIGFQGDDPMTDFRGMGLLGLQNLVFFATVYTDAARQLLSRSEHPQNGYSFAIVGINITGLAHQLLNSGHLKTHLYNVVHGQPRLEHFHQVYCYLLYEFDKFWFSQETIDIMQFNHVKQKFQKRIVQRLKDKHATLHGALTVGPSNNAASVPL
ncbi:hypothetical protein CAPTEDRAFT_156531 [Capitella teleta]|uniref:ELMO domain-containing protein n=1 Tax=Capitella teleta TaxID=283909 RepID=R7TX78_CAPTE|nr:hypothetical protein CAPTEDRAFT_156531 [Capitella teleta]|eukprot:ELT96056.1 hypothetical protein CAPTEDRAFT_156531 [Capitella teleta]